MAEQPLNNRVPITNQDGTPTQYFIRLLQERGFTIDDKITAAQAQTLIDAWAAARDINAGTGLDGGGSLATDVTINLDASLDDLNDVDFSTPPTSGDALTYDGTNWVPGAVAGGLDVQDEGSSVVNPATAINFIGSAVTVTDGGGGVADVTITGGGGGSATWELIYANGSIPNPTTNIDVDVTGYTDIYIIARSVSASSSGTRGIQLSVDGGSTFYTTTGDYVIFSDTGAETTTSGIIGHSTNTTAARTIAGDILNINASGVLKLSREIGGGRQRLFVASTDPITHIRLSTTAGNMTGGQFYVFGRGSSSSAAANTQMHVQDQKAAGTDGGTFTSGAWQTRTLNTVVTNTITGASLASNQITLPAGTYDIEGFSPACQVNEHQARLQNVTDATTSLTGTTMWSRSSSSTGAVTHSVVKGRITITGTKVFELQHRCLTTKSTNGFGIGSGNTWGTVVFADVTIRKIA